MDREILIKNLKRFKKKVENKHKIEKMVLFGSRAEQDKVGSESDVDLLIVSDDFSSLDHDEREKMLYRNSAGIPFDLHVYGFTELELKTASPHTSLGALRLEEAIKIQ